MHFLIDILKRNFLLMIILAIILTACDENGVKLTDGDKHITEDMDEAISNYIIQKYSTSYRHTEKQFEVHKVYGTSESKGVINVYMWSYFGGFNKITGTESQSGHSLPAVIQMKKDGEQYSIIKYIEPQDGSLYLSSLQKMFPEKYLKLAQKDAGNINDLQKEMDKKVKQWLGG